LKCDKEFRKNDDYFEPFIRNTIKAMKIINRIIVDFGVEENSNFSVFYTAVDSKFLDA
jgi:hypothetical protein